MAMDSYKAPRRSEVLRDIPEATRQRIVSLIRRGIDAAAADRLGEREYTWDDKVLNCASHAAVACFARQEFADEIAAATVKADDTPGFLVMKMGSGTFLRLNKLTKRGMPSRNKTHRSRIVHGEKQGSLFPDAEVEPLGTIKGFVFAGWLLDPRGKLPPAIFLVVPGKAGWSVRIDDDQASASAEITGETFGPQGGARRVDDAHEETGTE